MNRREFLGGLTAMGFAGCTGVRPLADDGTVRIAHCGDPQLGMSWPRTPDKKRTEEGYQKDLRRLEREIEVLNGMDLDLVYFAGDMTHDAEDVTRDWPRLLKRIRHPVAVSPGNHDMGNRLTAERADRFVSVFGSEYRAFDLKGWRMIVGNSQYWRPTDETSRAAKYEEWVRAELAAAKASGRPLILASHIPPYVSLNVESDSYENYPRAGRAARLESYIDAGARFYLAGHTHTMLQRAWKGMAMLNAETTCMNFDGRPFGFRLLTIRPDASFTWEFNAI